MFTETQTDIQFTGFVVTFNDEKYLAQCLESLSFCTQLLVLDLGSTDRSVSIAQQHGARVVSHPHAPIVEQVWANSIHLVEHDWVIMLDPDEILPNNIKDQLNQIVESNPNLAVIRVPWQFYFRGKPLRTTHWGRKFAKMIVHHKKHVSFTPDVHQGKEIMPGYDVYTIPWSDKENYIKHYWIDSYEQLIEKHKRYLEHEGQARYKNGTRFSWIGMAKDIGKSLALDLLVYRGVLGGFNGLFLSFFYSWYLYKAWMSLRKFQAMQLAGE